MKIAFLVRDLCHMGGVVTATQNLAGALAEKHQVEIVALRKVRDESYFPLDGRVRVRALTDLRKHSASYDGDDPLAHEFPARYPYPKTEQKPLVSRLAEKRLLAYLDGTDADVVVSSNPRITVLLAAARGRYMKIAQEHSMPGIYEEQIQGPLFGDAYRRLDAITVLSPEERDNLGGLVPNVRDRISVMPNCIPDPGGRVSDGSSKVVVTAGVLKPHKNFHGLIDAFATVVERHPDWRLRIYGSGVEEAALRRRIHERSLYNHVHLMGPAFPVTAEFAKGSIFVLPSLREPFGNVTVEAMTRGLPVVSMDCDHGPRNILTSGTDGLLVPLDDTEAMAAAINELIEDEDRRVKMGREARRTAERFAPGPSAERFEAIVAKALSRSDVVRALPGTADCTVLPDGDVQVELARRGTEDEVPAGLRLVCRDVRNTKEPVHVPFVHGTARIPRRGTLADGLWELGLASGEGYEKALRVGHCDVTDLVSPRHEPGGQGLEMLLPFREQTGHLRVRSRVRPRYSEVTGLEVMSDSVRIEADSWSGEEIVAGAAVAAVNRKDKKRVLLFPVAWAEGTRFGCEVPLDSLTAEHRHEEEIWDLWLRPADGAPVRMSKLATDVLEPFKVFKYPRPVRERSAGEASAPAKGGANRAAWWSRRGAPDPQPAAPSRVEIRPYFTTAAQLAFKTVTL
ncbi:glycosyltransferase [Streptomyces sp. NPDC057611]|uniref:glycosyltransferase n=1 Tax=Streptomyces sp. NPDC057611 TaxID=3346182 RepID=UPI0036B6841F